MQLPNRSRLLSIALAAFLCVAVPVEHFAANQIKVDTISGLQLAGYSSSDLLKWTIRAQEAALKPGSGEPGTDAIKTGTWSVRNLKVETFSYNSELKKNVTDITVESPDAEFFPKKRFAQSESRVSVKSTSEVFSVNGRGWYWHCDNAQDANRIAVKHDVTLTLFPKAKDIKDKTPLTVTSESLVIEIKDNETILTFERAPQKEVIIRQGEVVTHCDTLSIVILGDAKHLESAGKEEREDEESVDLDKIKKIAGSGNVRIHIEDIRNHGDSTKPDLGQRKMDPKKDIWLHGDSVELFPAKNRFDIRGNVHFNDGANALAVRGENATGYTKTENKKFILEQITIDNKLPGQASDKRVAVTMNSLEHSQKNTGTQALFQGETLSLHFAENGESIVRLEKNVSLDDATISMRCDNLEVRSKAKESVADSSPLSQKERADVREVIASGNVTARQNGRILECGRAHILPPENYIELSDNPKIRVPAENFELTGARCEIFSEQKIVKAYGDPEKKQRVTANFFPPRGTGTPATLSGNILELTQDLLNPKISVLRLSEDVTFTSPQDQLDGVCDRLIVWFDPKSKALKSNSANRDSLAALQKIEALGNVHLNKEDISVSGGKAMLFTQIELEEWLSKDADGSDGQKPMKIIVLPDEKNIAETRPVITLPQTDTTAAFSLPLPSTDEGKKAPANKQPIQISGDELETLFGELRIRCWLRGNVLLKTDTASCQSSELEAELRRANTKAEFEPEVIFCRDNVRITRDDAVASGDLLEVSPRKKLGALSGNATIKSAAFGETTPGKSAGDRFILDLEKQEVRIEALPKALRDNPAQVARPKTLLPKGIFERFSESNSEKKSQPSKK